MKKYFIPLIIFSFILLSCSQMKKKADLIIYSTKVYTVNPGFSVEESIVVKGGKIIDVGTTAEMFDKYSAPEVYNGIGKAVYPGFIDGHCHFYGYGTNAVRSADLAGTGSFEEILEIIEKHYNKYKPDWLIGRGWDQNDWEDKSWPDKEELDVMFPDVPVVLKRIDGHADLANSEALKRAGIKPDTLIEGGDIFLDQHGNMTGILIDKAGDFLEDHIPALTDKEMREALLIAEKDCIALGLTSVVDAGLYSNTVKLIDSLHKNGTLRIKINAMLSPEPENIEEYLEQGPYVTDKLTVNSIKLYADGALGSRGALLKDPYEDDPHNVGLQIKPAAYYKDICKQAYEYGYQVNTHAIGDSGVKLMLDVYGQELKNTNDRRWRIEHAQIVDPDDLGLFRKYSIIPSIQATHATSDMYWADERIGDERIKWAYTFKDLLAQNGWIINGTDFPVEKIHPLHTFYASVARKDLDGNPENGFQKENALSREETLKSMTIWAAKGSFEENRKGSIEIGKDADFVILEKDIMEIDEAEIPGVRVVRTYIDGEEVYRNGGVGY